MLDAEQLVEQAVEKHGLDDFGDGRYREGLDRLVDSLNREAQLSELGEMTLAFQIGESLRNRLEVIDWAASHPSVTATPVERPLIVLGLPRSGTTLLSYLLDCDPARRSLLRWEGRHAVPPPTTATLRTDPRVAIVESEAAMLDGINPEFKGIHYEAADGPTEDVTILAQDYRSILWECLANVPSYAEWLYSTCDFTSAYEYHRTQLQVQQSEAPGVWALKAPQHCLSVDALVATYPDARLVMTHRDPLAVTASMASLVRSLTGTFTDADHSAYIAEHWSDVLVTMMERVMDWRDAHGDDRFFDLPYDDLVGDPLGAMGRLYDAVGDELTPEVERNMRDHLDANPQGKHGGHRYSLDTFGLDEPRLRERFSRYTDRYGLEPA